MPKSRSITYNFDFEKGSAWNYILNFDEAHHLVPGPSKAARPWTDLEFCKCSHCPLNHSEHPQCPVARNIDHIIEDSKEVISYTEVVVTVSSPERQYMKKCATQSGLVSLFGLIMATSGCPHLDWLRPLARFHLPFSSIEETLFRVLSLQLLGEFFNKERKDTDTSSQEIKRKYAAVGTLNHSFIQRIKTYCAGDADKNAIAALDIWVQAFELYHEDNFEPIREYFVSESEISKE
jgi:hypothetical protein